MARAVEHGSGGEPVKQKPGVIRDFLQHRNRRIGTPVIDRPGELVESTTETGGALTHLYPGRVIEQPQVIKEHGVPPTPEEIEALTQPHEDSFLTRVAKSKLGKVATAVLGVPLGVAGYYGLETAKAAYYENFAPSKGDIFNPRAVSGEITNQNASPLPTAEAVRLAQQKSTSPAEGFHIPLPEPGDIPIKYTVKDGELMLDDIPVGRELMFPFKGKLSWQRSPNGYISISIEGVGVNDAKEGDKTIITIGGKSFSLLIPNDRFTTAPLPGTNIVRSSQVDIIPGQPIIVIKSNEKDDQHPYGSHQVYIGGGWKRAGQTSPANVDVKILQSPNTGKAVYAPAR